MDEWLRTSGLSPVDAQKLASVPRRHEGDALEAVRGSRRCQRPRREQHPLSSATLQTPASGAPIERYRYEAFGAPRVFDGAGKTSALPAAGPLPVLGGMPFLPELALYRTPARLYEPATGLFLARDPLLPFGSPSPYVFAAHDPWNHVDPDGQIAPLIGAGLVVAAIGSVVGMASVVVRGGEYVAWDVLLPGDRLPGRVRGRRHPCPSPTTRLFRGAPRSGRIRPRLDEQCGAGLLT